MDWTARVSLELGATNGRWRQSKVRAKLPGVAALPCVVLGAMVQLSNAPMKPLDPQDGVPMKERPSAIGHPPTALKACAFNGACPFKTGALPKSGPASSRPRHRLDEGISTFTGTWHDGHWRLSWMVTPWQGIRGQGRAVTWQSGWQQGQWRVGAMAMDGEGSPVTGYVSIAWLESRRWVRLPEDGARLSLWFEQKTKRLGRKGSWSGHLFWSPSQQETFRCGLRWSWEA